jgi:hypothetical protein
MKLERTSQENGKLSGLAQEEAQRRLDEVLRRYGIHLADSSARPIADIPASSLKEPAKLKLGPAPSIRKKRMNPINGKESGSVLIRREGRAASGLPPDDRSFHFLVRIAECTSVLHCEVKADYAAKAREQVQRIPNLVEWREISFGELLEIAKNAE